jgi:hypothetical protein
MLKDEKQQPTKGLAKNWLTERSINFYIAIVLWFRLDVI